MVQIKVFPSLQPPFVTGRYAPASYPWSVPPSGLDRRPTSILKRKGTVCSSLRGPTSRVLLPHQVGRLALGPKAPKLVMLRRGSEATRYAGQIRARI